MLIELVHRARSLGKDTDGAPGDGRWVTRVAAGPWSVKFVFLLFRRLKVRSKRIFVVAAFSSQINVMHQRRARRRLKTSSTCVFERFYL